MIPHEPPSFQVTQSKAFEQENLQSDLNSHLSKLTEDLALQLQGPKGKTATVMHMMSSFFKKMQALDQTEEDLVLNRSNLMTALSKKGLQDSPLVLTILNSWDCCHKEIAQSLVDIHSKNLKLQATLNEFQKIVDQRTAASTAINALGQGVQKPSTQAVRTIKVASEKQVVKAASSVAQRTLSVQEAPRVWVPSPSRFFEVATTIAFAMPPLLHHAAPLFYNSAASVEALRYGNISESLGYARSALSWAGAPSVMAGVGFAVGRAVTTAASSISRRLRTVPQAAPQIEEPPQEGRKRKADGKGPSGKRVR